MLVYPEESTNTKAIIKARDSISWLIPWKLESEPGRRGEPKPGFQKSTVDNYINLYEAVKSYSQGSQAQGPESVQFTSTYPGSVYGEKGVSLFLNIDINTNIVRETGLNHLRSPS